MEKRDFKGIWIDREIWESKDLTLQEKVFLVEITSLDNEKGCFATNRYFADFFELSRDRVSAVINSLVEKGYITSNVIKGSGNARILRSNRKVILKKVKGKNEDGYMQKDRNPIGENAETLSAKTPKPYRQKDRYPIGENAEHNNIVNNDTNITKNKIKKQKGEFLKNSDFSEIEQNTLKNSGKRFSEGLTNYMKSIIETYNNTLNKNEVLENIHPTFSTNCKKLYLNNISLADFKLSLAAKLKVKKLRQSLTILYVTNPRHILAELRHTSDLSDEEYENAAERLKSEAKYEKEKFKYQKHE